MTGSPGPLSDRSPYAISTLPHIQKSQPLAIRVRGHEAPWVTDLLKRWALKQVETLAA
jgi:hypothetical protein